MLLSLRMLRRDLRAGELGLLLVALMWLGAAHRAWMLALPIGCMAVVCIWLWLRPEPPVDGQDRR